FILMACASRPQGVAGPKGRYSTKRMPAPVVYRTELTGLARIHEGKVRDIYALDDDTMLIVTTDRLSAFDVVLPDPIPDKGRVLNGISLPRDLKLAGRLPQPLFTPATKARIGAHDENISFEEVAALIGAELAAAVRDTALALYGFAAEHARSRGILIADSKFEFGLDSQGRLTLIDEVLTPDSSRFWPADSYRAGVSPPSFDKQFVR